MRRRDFINIVGAAAAWPFAAHGQQAAMPVIGFLDVRSPETIGDRLAAFRQGLKETGCVEGDNVTIAYRWGENQTERLPELAADLVHLKAAVITTAGPPAAFAAKAATTTIPSLFIVADDPVLLGLVTNLGRPAGNLTGINSSIRSLQQSGWRCCTSLCLRPGVSLCSLIPRMLRIRLRRCATSIRPVVP
jgi:putative tryptophan/tyrosine transport system substrate-binding protein